MCPWNRLERGRSWALRRPRGGTKPEMAPGMLLDTEARSQGQGVVSSEGVESSIVRNKVGPWHKCWGLTCGFISRPWEWERWWCTAGYKQLVHRGFRAGRFLACSWWIWPTAIPSCGTESLCLGSLCCFWDKPLADALTGLGWDLCFATFLS